MKRVKEDRLGIQRIAVDCVGRACLAIMGSGKLKSFADAFWPIRLVAAQVDCRRIASITAKLSNAHSLPNMPVMQTMPRYLAQRSES
jgi:hypothetical protein